MAKPDQAKAAKKPTAPRASKTKATLGVGSGRRSAKSAAVGISAEDRYAMIAHEAYLRAVERGFAPGNELDDWLAAEAEIEMRLASR